MVAARSKKKTRKKRKVLSPKEKDDRRKKNKLHTGIKSFFKSIGFEIISTTGQEKTFGGIRGDLDGAYIYENIIVLCEETISSDNDHLRKKYDYFQQILQNKNDLLSWLKKLGSNKFKKFGSYPLARYKVFYIYATTNPVDEGTRVIYSAFHYFGPKVLKYFLRVSTTIRFSCRSEFFRFLNLELTDIGAPSSSSSERQIDSAVIVPESSSGFPEGIHVVSFIMKAKELLDCAYVFRKDSWENQVGQYYQRLVDKSKIERIRAYLAREGRTFIDNIIVTLPEGTTFTIKEGLKTKPFQLTDISTITNVQIRIPYRINSIGIIDGQHRVLGHYEGNDQLESKIQILREKRHLFVTGIFYEDGKFDDLKKRIFESGLFLIMNTTHSKVRTDLLQHIEALKAPLSAIGVASNVLVKLNDREPFLNLFKLSPLDKEGIRTPTIVKFGLQGLVEISNQKETLFKYWHGAHKKELIEGDPNMLIYENYLKFCVSSLSIYFGAIKANFGENWNLDKENRLLTSTAIVAFIKSFATALQKYKGSKDFEFYRGKFSRLTIKFTKKGFSSYGSSHWPALSAEIDRQCWD